MPLRAALLCASLLATALAGCAEAPAPDVPAGTTLSGSDLPDGEEGSAGSSGGATGGPAAGGPSRSGAPSGPGPAPSMPPQPSGPSGSPSGSGSTAPGGKSWSVPRALHESAWLCQAPVSVQDLTTAGTDDLQCSVQLSFTDTAVTVRSTGIPNHDFESGGGCCAAEQAIAYTFPLQPAYASAVTMAPTRGNIALAVNGAPMYGPEDADDQDVVVATRSSPTTQPRLELCDAHSAPSGAFHYHADANCVHVHGLASWDAYSFDALDGTAHSKIVGFAFDGFPIYGSFGHGPDNATVKEMASSYRLKAGATGASGIDDYEYVPGLGDLDECNGKETRTPDFPDGVYAYFSTLKNGEGDLGFPYFPLCYKGVVSSTATQGGTGGTGGMPPGGSGSTTGTASGMPQPPPGGSMSGSQSGMPPPPPPGGGGGGGGGMPPPPG